jgi:hypothetical protein
VSLRANPEFDRAAPLSQARVTVRLRDGRVLTQSADGARGYPGRITEEELARKFAACAGRVMPVDRAVRAWTAVRAIERADVRALMTVLRSG